MTAPYPLHRLSAVCGADEPVLSSHSLLPGARVPRFGEIDVWDFNGVLRRPANVTPASWKVRYSLELAEPTWNLLARELVLIMLNPRHPKVIDAGLSLRPRPARLSTVMSQVSHLRCLARWAIGQHLPASLPAWQDHDVRRFIHDRTQSVGTSVIRSQIALLKMLHQCGRVFTGGGLRVDPWRGTTARQAASDTGPTEITTPVIPPEQWFPLVRAAWTYVHTFAPDILRAQRRYNDLRAAADDTADLQERLDTWLAGPGNRIPVHPTRRGELASRDRPNLSLLTLMIGVDATNRSSLSSSRSAASTRRRDTITQLIAGGHPTIPGLVDHLATVTRADGTTGPWSPGLDTVTLLREQVAVRGACFVLVVALSMMRDGEVHEITRGAIVEHYGTPAIAATKRKHDPTLPTKHWWIIQPVAEAIAVAEQLPSQSDLVFSPLGRRRDSVVVRGSAMLDTFIAHINAHHADTGLEPIPPGRVRSHMFRRTMAMLTDQFAGSEIALGIQLKHVATRALANRSTSGYAAHDASWAQHLDSAIASARFRRLEDLYHAHTTGEPLGYGPAAERMAKAFQDIQETVQARGGDAAVERALLRKARISIRFGTLNHCAFDENNPTGALCLENAIIPPGHTGPLQDRCRPDRCGNSIIAPEHVPIWNAEKHTLLTLLDTPKLPPCRKATLQRELTDVEAVLGKADKENP